MTKQQKKEDLMKINPSKMDNKNDWMIDMARVHQVEMYGNKNIERESSTGRFSRISMISCIKGR